MSHDELIEYAVKASQIEEKLAKIIDTKLDEKLTQIVDEKLEILKAEIKQAVSEEIETFKKHAQHRFEKLESEIEVVKGVNATLSKQLIDTQKESYRTAQYTQYETIEFSGLPTEIDNVHIETAVRGRRDWCYARGKEIQACHWEAEQDRAMQTSMAG